MKTIYDFALEARRKKATEEEPEEIEGAEDSTDYDEEAPDFEDPDVETEDPEGETDYDEGAPDVEEPPPEENPDDAPADRGDETDYDTGAPDEGEPVDAPPAETDSPDNPPPEENPDDPNNPAGDSGVQIGGNSPNPTPATGGDAAPAEAPTTDYGAGSPGDEGEAGDAPPADTGNPDGAVDVDTGGEGEDNNTAGSTDYSAGAPGEGEDDSPPDDTGAEGDNPEAEENPEGGEEGVDDTSMNTDDPTIQDAAQEEDPDEPIDTGNGDDVKALSENDKKQNIILLRSNFVALYRELDSMITKINDAKKDNMVRILIYSQVSKNLEKLKRFLYKYITMYYDNTDYDINEYNFYYILEIMHFNLEMIKRAQEKTEKSNDSK